MPVYSNISTSRPIRNGNGSVAYGKTVTNKSGIVSSDFKSFNEPDSFRLYDINLNVTNATEGSIRIPDGTTFIEFQGRTSVDVRWAFTSGNAFNSTSPYQTLKAGGSYYNDYPGNGLFGETIYFAAASNVTIEFRGRVGYERN